MGSFVVPLVLHMTPALYDPALFYGEIYSEYTTTTFASSSTGFLSLVRPLLLLLLLQVVAEDPLLLLYPVSIYSSRLLFTLRAQVSSRVSQFLRRYFSFPHSSCFILQVKQRTRSISSSCFATWHGRKQLDVKDSTISITIISYLFFASFSIFDIPVHRYLARFGFSINRFLVANDHLEDYDDEDEDV